MKYIKAILGYTVAGITILLALTAFVGNDGLRRALMAKTGLSITPLYTGGEIVKTIDHGGYRTDIHQTVFSGVFAERKVGFVQIDWVKKTDIPEKIIEDIDFDDDRRADFTIYYDTVDDAAAIKASNLRVIDVEGAYRRTNGFTVRVSLKND
jgi:hypothetical protein